MIFYSFDSTMNLELASSII